MIETNKKFCRNLDIGGILGFLFHDKPNPRTVDEKAKTKARRHRKEVKRQKRRAA